MAGGPRRPQEVPQKALNIGIKFVGRRQKIMVSERLLHSDPQSSQPPTGHDHDSWAAIILLTTRGWQTLPAPVL